MANSDFETKKRLVDTAGWIALEYFLILISSFYFSIDLGNVFWKLLYFLPVGLYVLIVLWRSRVPFRDYGFDMERTFMDVRTYLIAAVVLLGSIILSIPLVHDVLGKPDLFIASGLGLEQWEVFLYIAVASFLYEFCFRAFVLTRVRALTSQPVNLALFDAILFSIGFAFFSSFPFLLIWVFAANLVLAHLYSKRPDFLLSWITHIATLGMLFLIYVYWQ